MNFRRRKLRLHGKIYTITLNFLFTFKAIIDSVDTNAHFQNHEFSKTENVTFRLAYTCCLSYATLQIERREALNKIHSFTFRCRAKKIDYFQPNDEKFSCIKGEVFEFRRLDVRISICNECIFHQSQI